MLEKLKKAFKAILKWVIIPVGMVFTIIRIIAIANRSKSKSSIDRAQTTDDQLKLQQERLNAQATIHVQTAEQLAKELQEKVSEDWHLRTKK